MIKNCKPYRLSLMLVTVIAILGLQVMGCSKGTAAEKKIETETLTICTDPRPQICTMDYRPVCGQKKDGSVKTYSNGCSSCSDPDVVGYRDGECVSAQ